MIRDVLDILPAINTHVATALTQGYNTAKTTAKPVTGSADDVWLRVRELWAMPGRE